MPLSPDSGPTIGGNTVDISGTGLLGTTAVHFGTKTATIVGTPTDVLVTVTAPSGAGTVPVTVTTPAGTSNAVPYYYIGAPSKSSLSSTSGPVAGGNTVTLQGTGLSTVTGVAFGGVAGTALTSVNDNMLTVDVPASGLPAPGTGAVSVTVTTTGGTSNGLTYNYVAVPTAPTLSPNSGAAGIGVTMTSTDLNSTESVTFGGTAAPFDVLSNTQLVAVAPTGLTGAQPVVITNAGGASGPTTFTYSSGPAI